MATDASSAERASDLIWSSLAGVAFKHAKIVNDGSTPLKPAEVILVAEFKRILRGAAGYTVYFSRRNPCVLVRRRFRESSRPLLWRNLALQVDKRAMSRGRM